MFPVDTLNFYLALGVVLMQIVTVALLALYFLDKKYKDLLDISNLVQGWGLFIGFAVSLFGVVLTLFYSEVLGFAPCGLCWLGRVFLYPQTILFMIALWKKERSIADYSIGFSIFGAIVSLYQHYLQMGGTVVLPCPVVAAQGADCAQRFLFEFNYVTFPLMGFSVFAFLIVLMLFVRRK